MAELQGTFDDRDGWIWFDGEMVPWRDARVHVLTHALHYASSVFEGQRAYNGEIFKLREHSERLRKSASLLGFELPWTVDEIDAACVEALKSQDGIRLDVAPWRRPAPYTAPTESKASGLYMICTLSKQRAEERGFDDALMFDWRGRVAEATGANIFFVRDGTLHTPTPDCFLDGITRRTIKDLAHNRGIEVSERPIWPEELESFQQMFLTGTAVEVTPVRSAGAWNFEVGDMTRQLAKDYDDLVNGRIPND